MQTYQESYHAIVRALKALEDDERLVVQANMPVAVSMTHRMAPCVVMGVGNVINANWPDRSPSRSPLVFSL